MPVRENRWERERRKPFTALRTLSPAREDRGRPKDRTGISYSYVTMQALSLDRLFAKPLRVTNEM